MKTGIEVEGRFRGLPTLFLSAAELFAACATDSLAATVSEHPHIYISDHANVVDPTTLCRKNKCLSTKVITLEVTSVVPHHHTRPENVTLMLRFLGYDAVSALRPTDMFKFTRESDRSVKICIAHSLMHTDETEFHADTEIT